MADTWTHLVRFYHNGIPTFGQLVDSYDGGDLPDTFKVKVASGDPVNATIKYTGETAEVVKKDLLAPVANVPIVINVGLNYSDHIEESQFHLADLAAPIPYIFYRPTESIAAPYQDVRVYKVQQECLDYEGEMVFQTDRFPLRDISVEEASKHIIGFSVGNDFSPRPGKVLGKMNFIYSKAFDDWTPVGPVLVNPSVVGDLPQLDLKTTVNGKVKQSSNTKNMIFNVAEILSNMSVGHTVAPGTVVFSGTCSGGEWFAAQGKGGYKSGLVNGDVVEVELAKLGKIRTKVVLDE
ncbi:uncharacterized protein BDZ99DRAFT_418922 [Mytilinidion resinicola]|uniref:Fumarylacetoacetase-like C-terminal domain-containing protein n=1 Tax=Mytilinidion resinicola TaxID=574789 RepID=A0A6A6YH36_9PEZI|nr:uncharacterized protein BDZ99DRAFT_418922 [Mytilinidion resinicola]KAF2808126.1 hypothetical protein BDZ99DRAFT_418922 [Mytilinidion resinicola]